MGRKRWINYCGHHDTIQSLQLVQISMKPAVIGFRFFIIQELFYMTTGYTHLQGIPLALPPLWFLCTPLFIIESWNQSRIWGGLSVCFISPKQTLRSLVSTGSIYKSCLKSNCSSSLGMLVFALNFNQVCNAEGKRKASELCLWAEHWWWASQCFSRRRSHQTGCVFRQLYSPILLFIIKIAYRRQN